MKKFTQAVALALATAGLLASCNTNPAPQAEPSAAEKALVKIAQAKGLGSALSKSDVILEGQKYRIAHIERTAADGSTEAVMAFEKPDGSFELNGISTPASDGFGTDQLDNGVVTRLLDAEGKVKATLTLGEAQSGEFGTEFAPIIYWVLRVTATFLVRYYGRQVVNYGCNWLMNKVREQTGWSIPTWFQSAACRYISSLIVNYLVYKAPSGQTASIALDRSRNTRRRYALVG